MRLRVLAVAALVVVAYGCATSAPPPKTAPESLHGVASWYGEEFAGRTTANGEIFDPTQLTAAHRTLPFGTVIDVTNPKTRQSVRVRVNDRGPYIGNRVLDLSYAAAQKIGLIEPGTGQVDIAVVKLGTGEREPPAPFEATIAEALPVVVPAPATEAPNVEIPIPQEPVVVDRVEVEGGRKQVAEDGTTIRVAPLSQRPPTPQGRSETGATRPQFFVQVGAFAVEANANALRDRLTAIGQKAWIARDDLFRVRMGPFATRDQAVTARGTLEANGVSAIIVAE